MLTSRPRPITARSPRLLWTGALLLAGIGLFTLYLRQSLVGPVNSDGAANVLQAQAILHGNVLLRGWWVSDVSFYTTELPEYTLVEALRGLRPDVVHICGALSYALAVLLAALLGRGRATGRAGVVRALLAGGIMLAPGIRGGTEVFLENPDHAGTAVPVLALLLLLDRAPERGYALAAFCGLLAWVQVGDQLTLVAVTGPAAAVAVVRLLVLAARRRPFAQFRYDALLLAAAGLSVGLASLAKAVIRLLGGFQLNPVGYGLAPLSQLAANVRMTGQVLLVLFGVNNPRGGRPGTTHQLLGIIAQFHLIGLVLAAGGFAVAIVTFFALRMDRVTQITVAGAAAMLAAGIFSTVLSSLAHAHDVAILLPLGAVLAGRVLPPLVPARWRPGRAGALVLATWLAAGLAALCFAASQAPARAPNQQLADWLLSHHATDGLAGYWESDVTTVASGGKVLVAPIPAQATGQWHWESSASWYQASQRQANFIVTGADPGAGLVGVSPAAARRSFGVPAHQYQIGQFVVMMYHYNLLSRFTTGPLASTS